MGRVRDIYQVVYARKKLSQNRSGATFAAHTAPQLPLNHGSNDLVLV